MKGTYVSVNIKLYFQSLIKKYGSPYLSSAQRNGQLIDITKIRCIQDG